MPQSIRRQLLQLQDPGYRAFHCALMPMVDPDRVIGVRTPVLKGLAKKMDSVREYFLEDLPHRYYEENNLHAFFLNEIRDFEDCIRRIQVFLPYVDNWATCDGLRPKSFARHKKELLAYISGWLESGHPYTVRFAIEMLMVHYLEGDFALKYPEMVSKVCSEEYYVNMMIAWYFATALAKQWDGAVVYLQEGRLPRWVHNKAIQKAVESSRITREQKEYLRKLRK